MARAGAASGQGTKETNHVEPSRRIRSRKLCHYRELERHAGRAIVVLFQIFFGFSPAARCRALTARRSARYRCLNWNTSDSNLGHESSAYWDAPGLSPQPRPGLARAAPGISTLWSRFSLAEALTTNPPGIARRDSFDGVDRLVECESDQARAKQHKACNCDGEKACRSEFIAHGTPPFRVPRTEENDRPLAQSKSFLSRRSLSMPGGVLMQQWPVTVSRTKH